MLNEIIKIDLHIHSDASGYKDPNEIVKDSNISNSNVLLDALLQHNVRLFSITDHNRFNKPLYEHLNIQLNEEEYKGKLNLVYGVEFDVLFQEKMKPAHIVTIFDVKSDEDMDRICKGIESDKLTDKKDSYSTKRFEEVLKKIGLNCLLIVHQKKELSNHNGKHASLSDSTDSPERILKVGYVDALEFQKPRVEGILKANLKEIDYEIPLITGSDCHQWSSYPKHNEKKISGVENFTEIKALPTFKGLHLAMSSPQTRMNRFKNNRHSFIESITVNEKVIPLDPGLNAIIGENGSGKSTILEILNSKKEKSYVNKLRKENNIQYLFKGVSDNIKYIHQSEIIKKFETKSLLNDENKNFKDINHDSFESGFSEYAKELNQMVKKNIEINKLNNTLENIIFYFDEVFDNSTYYVDVVYRQSSKTNPHEVKLKVWKNIINLINKELDSEYYTPTEQNTIRSLLEQAILVYRPILNREIDFNIQENIKNILHTTINSYSSTIEQKKTALDKRKTRYDESKIRIIEAIFEAVQANSFENKIPQMPNRITGVSTNQLKGFDFNKEAYYNDKDLSKEFLKRMFNKQYQSIDEINKIKTNEEFCNAIRNARIETIDQTWEQNLSKFIIEMKEEQKYLVESSKGNQIGNTMGELSLAYYKFHLIEEENIHIFIIDQPEDNISNLKIADELINYINSMRDDKQVIFVTHNPLLVVNLDVDNVLFLNKINDKIDVIGGCLEDEKNGILELISEQMDGGKEMIAKRLKIYE